MANPDIYQLCFFRFETNFFLSLTGSEKSAQSIFCLTGWLHKKALLLADLESPGKFQMHYFNGKTEENMQHTSKFSPAAH